MLRKRLMKLGQVIGPGLKHLITIVSYLVSEYVEHYHSERPHQAKGNVPLSGDWPAPGAEPPDVAEVVCQQRLGGLLKHYERQAA